jgi:hypothetical protein
MINKTSTRGGYLMVMVLVFAGIFLTIVTSFVIFIVTQSRLIEQKINFEQSGQIAEAGLNYFRWYLAHYPNSTTTSYTGIYKDPEGGDIGEYTISVASTTFCGVIASRQVTSVGHTYADPGVIRTMSARYARPNVASYAYILNSSVWAGPDRIINGPYHSNGGVRMDGTNNSSVTSGVSTWSCTSTFGCGVTVTRNGVFTTTANANTALFDFPAAPVDFAGITLDLTDIHNRAQTGGGIVLPPSGGYGYRVIFNSNNTITVRPVTGTTQYWGSTNGSTWAQERHVVSAVGAAQTYTIPSSCPVISVQDKIWLEGTIPTKVTISAFSSSSDPSIVLQNNITYTSATTSGLLAIAEQDVLIGVDVPNDMTLNGIFIAQNGRYGRNHYCASCSDGGNSRGLPNSLDSYVIRNSETLNGTVVSNGRVGTQWTAGGVTVSGFQDRYTSFDRNLVENPPPFIPETSDVYEFNDWRDSN